MSAEPLDAYLVAEVLKAELDGIGRARGAPAPRMAAAATVYRLARALAQRLEGDEADALARIADEPWQAGAANGIWDAAGRDG